MFRKRDESTPPSISTPVERVTSVLGPGIAWKGVISGSGGVRIEGAFEGDISLRGMLVVGETGRVTCEALQANVVIVAGALRGDITAEKVEIRSTGRVWGNVVTTAFATEELGHPTLRSVLKKIDHAMEKGKLKLKSSRLRKSRGEINAILNKNVLASLHRECTRAFSLSQQLISSEETQVAQSKIKQLQGRFKELRRRKKAFAVKLDALEREHDQLLKKVEEQKGTLEKLVYEALEKRVNLDF